MKTAVNLHVPQTVWKSFTTWRIHSFSQKSKVSLRKQMCEKNHIPNSRTKFIPPGVLDMYTRRLVALSKRR